MVSFGGWYRKGSLSFTPLVVCSLVMSTQPQNTIAGVIVVAAGASTRMNGIDKTFTPLGGVPLIARTVAAFEVSPQVGAIVIVVGEHNLGAVRRLAEGQAWRKVTSICVGGSRRQDSVANGLSELPPCDWVLVHDGARPFVDEILISRGLEAARATGAAIPGIPPKDTVKVVDASDVVQSTLDRNSLRIIQTPQVFRRDILEKAHCEVTADVTDDAAMVESLGASVRVFTGSYRNIKVTTPEDKAIAEALLKQGNVSA
jgi:2-C-methyl-D-erythritol 4-phosphate cytidylyltransferase